MLNTSVNYARVQDQILGAIQRHLDPGEYSLTHERRLEGAYNFTLFIAQPADGLQSHGAADKSYFYRKDKVGRPIAEGLKDAFVPGPWLRRRLVKGTLPFTESQVHAVGWPRLDLLLEMQAAHRTTRASGGRKRVLWAPTHDFVKRGNEGVTTSSYPEFAPYAERLARDFEVMTSLHPRNRKDKQPTAELLIEADYVISDFGTLVYEAWALGKPVIFPHWIIGDRILQHLGKHSAERRIFQDRIGLHPGSFEEMRDMLADGPAIDARAAAFIEDYLPAATHGVSGRLTAETLRRLAG